MREHADAFVIYLFRHACPLSKFLVCLQFLHSIQNTGLKRM